MLHILYKNTKSCRGTHSRKRRGRNCCCKGKAFIWIVQGFWKKSAELEVVFNRCWVFRDAKCGICKPKLGIYTPRVMGRGTLVHSLGSMNLSPMILTAAANLQIKTELPNISHRIIMFFRRKRAKNSERFVGFQLFFISLQT